MKKIFNGFRYAFFRNIGWQDRTIRTLAAICATAGALYFIKTNSIASIVLSVFAIAQSGTALSARCIMCYFVGARTISTKEKNKLIEKGIDIESK